MRPLRRILVVTFDPGILAFERSATRMDFEPIPETLTETGCFADVAAHEFGAGSIPMKCRFPFGATT